MTISQLIKKLSLTSCRKTLEKQVFLIKFDENYQII